MQNESSSTNTVLLVIILLIIVGLAVWWLTDRSQQQPKELPPRNDAELNIDIEGFMPNDNDAGSSGSNPNNP